MMDIRNHLVHHWHHYSFAGIAMWMLSRIDLVWEKTEWMRAAVGWVKQKNKKKKRRHR